MLRIRYMPSDFHPLILILADRDDLGELAGVLDRFAHRGDEIDLASIAVVCSTNIRLASGSNRLGIWPDPASNGSWIWRLTAAAAEHFRDAILALGAPGCLAGSAMLECGTPGEVPAKVSHGEFTDDFLMPGSMIPS